MKSNFYIILFCLTAVFQLSNAQKNYNLIVEGFDWGPAVSKVVLELNEEIKEPINYQNFSVNARRGPINDIKVSPSNGERRVINSYVSTPNGVRTQVSNFLTLVLEVGPTVSIANPFQYSRGNHWVDYKLSIVDKISLDHWGSEKERFIPLVDEFDLSGIFKGVNSGKEIHYAAYDPKSPEKKPLIIWLHGGGEGGEDPTIPLLGNKAANYASKEIQSLFGGAHVLIPQSPTRWMDSGSGTTRGEKDDIYFKDIKALIETYIKNNNVDESKIYVGGCSNGGYLSLKLLLEYPDLFAAGYISALAFWAENVTDSQLEKIKDKPIWFIHSKDDNTTDAESTAIPVYNRLMDLGAKDIHLSLYDHVIDITGAYGGKQFHYPGHWSWIYSHANKSYLDYDGKPVLQKGVPVNLMQWMSSKKL